MEDFRGLLRAYQMDNMEYPPDPDEELCVHGMSAWLCMGPMHYPSSEQEMRGEYF